MQFSRDLESSEFLKTQIQSELTKVSEANSKSERCMLLCDERNIAISAREAGYTVKPAQLLQCLTPTSARVTGAYSCFDGETPEKSPAFVKLALRWLRAGWHVRIEKAVADDDVKDLMLLRIQDYDTLFILSGDGGYEVHLKFLQQMGKKVIPASFPKSTARRIREMDNWIDLTTICPSAARGCG